VVECKKIRKSEQKTHKASSDHTQFSHTHARDMLKACMRHVESRQTKGNYLLSIRPDIYLLRKASQEHEANYVGYLRHL
jgi:hypothetical protein